MEDNYEEFALLNEEMDDPFSNKIPLWPMNQKKTCSSNGKSSFGGQFQEYK